MSVLQAICKEISVYRENAISSFSQLLENFPNSVEAIRAYSVFVAQCEDNPGCADQLLKYAQELEDQSSTQKRKKRIKQQRSSDASEAPSDHEKSSLKGSELSGTVTSSDGNSVLDNILTQYMLQGTTGSSIKVGKSVSILKYSMIAFMATLLVSLIVLYVAYSDVISSATSTGMSLCNSRTSLMEMTELHD